MGISALLTAGGRRDNVVDNMLWSIIVGGPIELKSFEVSIVTTFVNSETMKSKTYPGQVVEHL